MILLAIAHFCLLFLLWTLLVYTIHRISHIKFKGNFLYRLHLEHHRMIYTTNVVKFKWYYLFFYFGNIYATLDVIITITIPALLVYLIKPSIGVFILGFHYIYEVFLSEGTLDHNPKIKGKITSFFAWGEYHLAHHKFLKYNYSLIITLWDYIFKTNYVRKSSKVN